MTGRVGRLWRDRAGSNAIEFAATALVMVLLIMGVLEGGLLFWSWQALQGATIDAARCAAINSTSCLNPSTTPANTQSYAVTAATARGLNGVTTGNVTVLTGVAAQTACGATTASVVSVTIAYTFGLPLNVPYLSPSLSASACFPLAAGS